MNTRVKKKQRTKEDIILAWKAKSSQNVYEVVLSTPDEGEICNIMQEEIATARLEWIDEEKDFFYEKNPKAKKATLQCGHVFYVTALAYHFVKNQMKCPVCRAGEKNTMNAQCIPKRIRNIMVQRSTQMLQNERREQEEADNQENQREIQRILSEEVLVNVFFTVNNPTERRTVTTLEIAFMNDTPNEQNYTHNYLTWLRTREHRVSPQNTDWIVARSQIRSLRNLVERMATYPSAMMIIIRENGVAVAKTGIVRIEDLTRPDQRPESVVTLCEISQPNHFYMQTAAMQVTQSDVLMHPGGVDGNVMGYVRMETMNFFEMNEPYNFPLINIKWSTMTYHT